MNDKNYTVEEVRALLRGMEGHALTVAERASLFVIAAAYADLLERIKADEGAAVTNEQVATARDAYNNALCAPGAISQISAIRAALLTIRPTPPAQAAQAGVTDEVVERATVAYARTASKHIPVSAVSMRAALLAVWPNAPAQAAQVPDGATEVIRRSLGSDGHAVSLAFRSKESADRFYTHMDEAMKVAQNTAAKPVAQGEASDAWPFVESPAEFTKRLSTAMGECSLLGAVRHVLIENPPKLAAAPSPDAAAQDE